MMQNEAMTKDSTKQKPKAVVRTKSILPVLRVNITCVGHMMIVPNEESTT